jgi:four helix bundle protein
MIAKDSVLYKKAFAFAVRIVRLRRLIVGQKREYVLSKQCLRSGTSIGANIAEANGAISRSDFSSKLSIAHKESLETKYWLMLLKETNYLSEKECISLFQDADELSRILFSILRTVRLKRKPQ